MRKLGVTVLALGGLLPAPWAHAQEAEEAPELGLDFLEYLGAWQGDDDEWLVIEEWQKDNEGADDEDEDESQQRRKNDDERE